MALCRTEQTQHKTRSSRDILFPFVNQTVKLTPLDVRFQTPDRIDVFQIAFFSSLHLDPFFVISFKSPFSLHFFFNSFLFLFWVSNTLLCRNQRLSALNPVAEDALQLGGKMAFRISDRASKRLIPSGISCPMLQALIPPNGEKSDGQISGEYGGCNYPLSKLMRIRIIPFELLHWLREVCPLYHSTNNRHTNDDGVSRIHSDANFQTLIAIITSSAYIRGRPIPRA
jgi:hypothetical protein